MMDGYFVRPDDDLMLGVSFGLLSPDAKALAQFLMQQRKTEPVIVEYREEEHD